jgi:hypothetical protein
MDPKFSTFDIIKSEKDEIFGICQSVCCRPKAVLSPHAPPSTQHKIMIDLVGRGKCIRISFIFISLNTSNKIICYLINDMNLDRFCGSEGASSCAEGLVELKWGNREKILIAKILVLT